MTAVIRNAWGWSKAGLSSALGKRSQRKNQQPQHIAWQALQPEHDAAYGFKRHVRTGPSIWSGKLMALPSFIAKRKAWISPLVLLEWLRRAAVPAMRTHGVDERNA
jgi:hypothetical protein